MRLDALPLPEWNRFRTTRCVAVFSAPQHLYASRTDDPARVLDAQELKRYSSFSHPEAAQTFLAGRVFLKSLLEYWMGSPPPAFQIGPEGKPFCPGPAAPRFSLSHAGGWVCAALSQQLEPGADIEALTRRAAYEKLSRRCFSQKEQREVAEQGREAFFRIWTRKEARLKADGTGLTVRLSYIDTSADPGWSYVTYSPARDLIATVAVKAESVSCGTYTLSA